MVHPRIGALPLQRLIRLNSRVAYHLPVRIHDDEVLYCRCEFQTQFDFVFSDENGQFILGQKVAVRSNTLRGPLWLNCQVTTIEPHDYCTLYQLTILP
jgi:hypothetical protein